MSEWCGWPIVDDAGEHGSHATDPDDAELSTAYRCAATRRRLEAMAQAQPGAASRMA